MNRILLFVIVYLFPLPSFASLDINADVLLGISMTPLPDGKSLFGTSIAFANIDNNTPELAQQNIDILTVELKFRKMLKNPIKHDSWRGSVYHDSSEILNDYALLVAAAHKGNFSSIAFFESVLRCGNVYGTSVRGLTPQPERARLYKNSLDLITKHKQLTSALDAFKQAKLETSPSLEEKRNALVATHLSADSRFTSSDGLKPESQSTIRRRQPHKTATSNPAIASKSTEMAVISNYQ